MRNRIRKPKALVEPLEDRRLLTAAQFATPTYIVAKTGLATVNAASPSSTPGEAEITPAQMVQAYGVNSIKFGSVVGNGAGQTIAIIDAYDDPNAASDLATFDSTYGLPAPPSFTKLSQTGTTTLPGPDTTDPKGDTWELEESLDIEWAHVIAPDASIILYEANSASYANLVTHAVNTARKNASVSVISMSWGGGEGSGEQSYDTYFTTPSGHQGVTFVASTGDDAAPAGYPSFSPNVVAVGGTTLLVSDSAGDYYSESAWSDGGGGTSTLETEPAYQQSVQSTGYRTVPDVSMDANPYTGVPVYDTYDGGWFQVGGTSLASPMFAAVVAIADQGRVHYGLGTLDGPTQTLPYLYQLNSFNFHDITTGNDGFAAGPGYDEATGIGSPVANLLVPDLAQPVITNFTASPSIVTAGTNITLTAAVSDVNGPVSSVSFYLESDATPGLQTGAGGDTLLGAGTLVSGVWTFAASTTNLSGPVTYYAVATDSHSIASPAATATATVNPILPAGFSDADIGSPAFTGSASENSTTGVWTVSGGGSDIYGNSDQFNFASESFTGDGTIIAEVTSMTQSDPWAKAGVMFRDDNTASSAFAAVLATPQNGVVFEWRPSAEAAVQYAQVSTAAIPVWVELVRSGSNYTAYYSSDGSNWNLIGATQSLSFASETNLAGVAVTAHNNNAICTATLASVSTTSTTSSALPAGFSDADIGSPAFTGSASENSTTGVWTVSGGGSDIYGNSDQFNFASESFTGDGTIIAEVTSMTQSDPWAKAGVMFRDDNTASSAFAAVLATPQNGVVFEWRPSAEAAVQYAQVSTAAIPVWVELVRSGSNYTAYYSSDGSNWNLIGATQSLSFASETNLAGVAVTAHNNNAICTATLASVSTTSTTSSALPAGFSDADIGSPAFTGSASENSTTGVWTVSGGGSDIYGNSDQFNFASESFTGDGTIIAEVTSMTQSDPWAKAGVMFRDDNTASSAFAAVLATPQNGVVFEWRPSAEAAVQYAQVSTAAIPVWVELVRSGSNYTAYYSSDGSNWNLIGATQSLSFASETNLAGVAVTAHNNNAICAATFASVSVNQTS